MSRRPCARDLRRRELWLSIIAPLVGALLSAGVHGAVRRH